jgi:HSP20 family protein
MVGALAPWRTRLPRTYLGLEEEMNRMMDRFFREEENGDPLEAFAPRTNVAETDAALEVTVELPGMKPEDFKVEIHNGNLWITGEKKEEKEEKGKTFHRLERRYGTFRRIFPLPTTVKAEKVAATYREGVLKVALEKTEEVKPKAIPVKC